MFQSFASRFALTAVFSVALFNCAVDPLSVQSEAVSDSAICQQGLLGEAINSTGKVPPGCAKIEGSQIGQAGIQIVANGVVVTILSGSRRTAHRASTSVLLSRPRAGPCRTPVKAGTKTFASTTGTWTHPAGSSGPGAKGISNITSAVSRRPMRVRLLEATIRMADARAATPTRVAGAMAGPEAIPVSNARVAVGRTAGP